MPRTFSLFRLLLGITAFCLLCGLAVNFPNEAFLAWLASCLFAPTLLVWLILVRRSKERFVLTALTIIGALIAACCSFVALIAASPVAGTPVPRFVAYLAPLAIGLIAAFGGLVLGGASRSDERHHHGGEP